MNAMRNRLRELVNATRRGRDAPLTIGEFSDRLNEFRSDSRVILTNGDNLYSIEVIPESSILHILTVEDGKRSTVDEVTSFMNHWTDAKYQDYQVIVGTTSFLQDVLDINGICYLIVKEQRHVDL